MFEIAGGILIAAATVFIGLPLAVWLLGVIFKEMAEITAELWRLFRVAFKPLAIFVGGLMLVSLAVNHPQAAANVAICIALAGLYWLAAKRMAGRKPDQ